MIHLENDKDYVELINNDLVLVDFYADWCGPCQMLGPILEELEKEVDNLKVVKINVDEHRALAMDNKIMSIPALKVYKKGKLVNERVGLMSKNDLKDLLK